MNKFSRGIAVVMSASMVVGSTTVFADTIIDSEGYRVWDLSGDRKEGLILKGGKHKVILRNVDFDGKLSRSVIDVQDGAEVKIILEGNNTLRGDDNHPAIWVEPGSTLTIEGTGQLNAIAGDVVGDSLGCAAIGGGYGATPDFGTININSGTVIAQGNHGGAGIGGGYKVGSDTVEGNINISGGYVKALGGEHAAGLGAGENCSYEGEVTITGGVVYASGGSANIGGGHRDNTKPPFGKPVAHGALVANGNGVIVTPGTVNATVDYENSNGIFVSNANKNSVGFDGSTVTFNDPNADIQVYGNTVMDKNIAINGGTTLNIINNHSLTMPADKKLTNNGTIKLGESDGDASRLILSGGKSENTTAGNGTLTVAKDAAVKVPLSDSIVEDIDPQEYTGALIEPELTVELKDLWGHTQKYSKENDYTVEYKNNTNVGKATATLKSTENGNLLKGEVTKTFEISDNVEDEAVTLSVKDLGIYEGNGLPTDFDLDLDLGQDEKIESLEIGGNPVEDIQTKEDAINYIKDNNYVTVKYVDSKGEEITDDLTPGVYTEELTSPETIKINGEEIKIDNSKDNAGKLTIRAVSDIDGVTSGESLISAAIIKDDTVKIEDLEKPAVIVEENTNYYINDDAERKVDDKSGISLLDDSLLGESYGNDNHIYETRIINKTNDYLKQPSSGYQNKYAFHYFDLVDEKNGNAWVSASNKDLSRTGENAEPEDTVTLYIPYPEGVDKNTDLQVVYYNDLHREYGENGTTGNQDNILADINASKIETIKPTKYENGITISVEKAKFGPFAIVTQERKDDGGGSSSGGSGGGSYQESDIIGKDRYETAGIIADRSSVHDTVILVNANEALSDGLSAAALSGKLNAPILLTKKDSIPKATMDRLDRVSNVYIIGGENAISKKVEEQLKGKKITRIGGKNRIETSMKIAEKIGNYDEAFIVNGYTGEADAMSASAVAAREVAPIILTNGKTSNYAKKSGVEYYAVGGNAVLDDKIVSKYNAERFGGDDRYETNRLIINEFYKNSSKYYFTKGEPLVDALTVSLHAKDNGVVLVSEKSDNSILKGKDIVQVGGMPFSIFPIK